MRNFICILWSWGGSRLRKLRRRRRRRDDVGLTGESSFAAWADSRVFCACRWDCVCYWPRPHLMLYYAPHGKSSTFLLCCSMWVNLVQWCCSELSIRQWCPDEFFHRVIAMYSCFSIGIAIFSKQCPPGTAFKWEEYEVRIWEWLGLRYCRRPIWNCVGNWLWDSTVVGIGFPTYSTHKAIESKNHAQQEEWLVYWAGSQTLIFSLCPNMSIAWLAVSIFLSREAVCLIVYKCCMHSVSASLSLLRFVGRWTR